MVTRTRPWLRTRSTPVPRAVKVKVTAAVTVRLPATAPLMEAVARNLGERATAPTAFLKPFDGATIPSTAIGGSNPVCRTALGVLARRFKKRRPGAPAEVSPASAAKRWAFVVGGRAPTWSAIAILSARARPPGRAPSPPIRDPRPNRMRARPRPTILALPSFAERSPRCVVSKGCPRPYPHVCPVNRVERSFASARAVVEFSQSVLLPRV
jgi:hypothetical protein